MDNDQERSPRSSAGCSQYTPCGDSRLSWKAEQQVRGETPSQLCRIRPVSNTKVHHNPAALDCQVLTDGCRVGKVRHKFANFGLNIDPRSLLQLEVNVVLCLFVRFSLSTRPYYCSVHPDSEFIQIKCSGSFQLSSRHTVECLSLASVRTLSTWLGAVVG
jgi:hypothetical protein